MNHELLLFFCSLWMGVFLLFGYDLLRIIRQLVHHSNFLIGLTDFLFWLGAAVYIFQGMYNKNQGIIRSYSILGIVLGMAAYHFYFSNAFVSICVKMIKFPLKIVKKIIKRLLFGLRRVRISLYEVLCRILPIKGAFRWKFWKKKEHHFEHGTGGKKSQKK